MSISLPVSVGGPQGSILGPLLSIISFNDMPNIVNTAKYMLIYADDTLLYYSSHSVAEIEKLVNHDHDLICRWLDDNLNSDIEL